MSIEFYWVGLALTLIIAVARFTRLATQDTFPPAKWLREQYVARTIDTGWDDLGWCVYCASVWVSFGVTLVWAYLAGVYTLSVPTDPSFWFTSWWLVNGSFAVAYLAAIFVSSDSADDSDEQMIVIKPADPQVETVAEETLDALSGESV